MQKPITVMQQETVERVIQLINDSGLPAFVLVNIFEGALAELHKLARDQFQNDKARYEAEQESQADDE